MRLVKLAPLTAAATLLLAALAGCGGDSDDNTDPTPTTAAPTTNDDGTAVPGTELKLGKKAVVSLKADQKHKSLIKLSISRVEKGTLKDLDRFDLTGSARTSSVYYVHAAVKNLGPDALSGTRITLYGKVSSDLVIPPVILRSTFPTCDYQPLPEKFKKGDIAAVCMVMLAPKHGKISEIQWRAADNSEPISWIVKK